MKKLLFPSSHLSFMWAFALAASVLGSSCGVKFKASLEDFELTNVASGPTDTTQPSVVLTASDSIPIIGSVTITATFSEAVTGVTAGDFNLTNLTAGAFTAVSSTVYTLVVSPVAVGAVSVAMNAGVAFDLASNPNTAAATLNDTYDPSCTISFTTDGSSYTGSLFSTGASTKTWTIDGVNYINVNSVNVNFGSLAVRNHTVKIDTGAEFRDFTSVGQNITALTFAKGCTGLILVDLRYNKLTALSVTMLPALENLQLGNSGGGAGANLNRVAALDISQNPNLKLLHLDYNNIVSIDTSNNPALETLWIQNTTTFTSYNGTGATALKELSLNYSPVTSVNLSNNLNLESFACRACDLTSLVVTANTALRNLYLAGNQISSPIDLSNNSQLRIFESGLLGMGTGSGVNTFTTIDFSNNPLIEQIWVDYSSLTTLNVNGKVNLNTLSCDPCTSLTSLNTTGATALDLLSVQYTPGVSLDLSTNVNLRYLGLYANGLSTINLTNNTALVWLNVAANNLDNTFSVAVNTAITWLRLGNVGYAGVDNPLLTAINLTNNTALEYLYIDRKLFTTLDLSSNTALKHLEGYYNTSLTSINLTGVTTLQDIYLYEADALPALDLSSSTALRVVALSYCDLDVAINFGAAATLQTVGINSSNISTLNLANKPNLTTILAQYSSLSNLTLSNNTSLNNVQFYGLSGGAAAMSSVFNSIFNERAVVPAGGTINMTANGVPSAPDLVSIATMQGVPYNWIIAHD